VRKRHDACLIEAEDLRVAVRERKKGTHKKEGMGVLMEGGGAD